MGSLCTFWFLVWCIILDRAVGTGWHFLKILCNCVRRFADHLTTKMTSWLHFVLFILDKLVSHFRHKLVRSWKSNWSEQFLVTYVHHTNESNYISWDVWIASNVAESTFPALSAKIIVSFSSVYTSIVHWTSAIMPSRGDVCK